MKPDEVQYIISQLDRIKDAQGEMNVTLACLTSSVDHHVKRTDLLEQQVKDNQVAVQAQMEASNKQIQRELKPLKRAYNLGAAALVILGGAISLLKLAHDFGLIGK